MPIDWTFDDDGDEFDWRKNTRSLEDDDIDPATGQMQSAGGGMFTSSGGGSASIASPSGSGGTMPANLQGMTGTGQDGQSLGGNSPYSSSFGQPRPVNQWTQDMRNILREQLGALGKAPTVDDPGIRENLAGRRLALQRSAERQRGSSAEVLASGGLADSGAAETNRLGIEQARGESEAQGVGEVLGAELNQRRQALQSLLGMALASGDAESAREIQRELMAMQDSHFNDSQAFSYSALNQQGNLAALAALLNAI